MNVFLLKVVGMVFMVASPTPLMQPDRNSWPGDALSEEQVLGAICQFAGTEPWKWILIGPGDWLLAGTSYRVAVRNDAPIPNIGIVRGYWGGDAFTHSGLDEIKALAERRAKDDLASGIKP